MSNKTVLLTGGHLTPALATISALLDKEKNIRIVYVGEKSRIDSKATIEQEEAQRIGAKWYSISSGKLHRFVTYSIVIEMLKIPIGLVQSFSIIKKERPDVVVSFGGYLSLPVAFCAKILHIPLVVHEQTTVWGAANTLLKQLADIVAVSWKQLEGGRTIYTGNPLRKEALSVRRNISSPLLYITGGHQGSTAIDNAIGPILPELVREYEIFHQTQHPCPIASKRYHSATWFSASEHASIMSKATLVVGRSGANTVAELAYLGIPSVLIPLPHAGGGEQLTNAKALEKIGLARIVRQNTLTPSCLLQEIHSLKTITPEARKRARELVPADAADRLADIILELITKKA